MKRFSQSILILSILVLTLLSTSVTAQLKYTTLSPGAWDDFEIWSTDGESSCHCAPPSELTDVTVQIQHTIASLSDISVGENGKLIIDAIGALEMSASALNVEAGTLVAYGRLQAQQLDICDEGQAMIGSSGLVGTKLEVHGRLDMIFADNDTFRLGSANFLVNYGGEVDLQNAALVLDGGDFVNESRVDLNNSTIYAAFGDIRNEGTIAFSNACITSMAGDLYNMGTLTGEGAVDIAGTLVSDQGVLEGINWCASEWYASLTDRPNCAVTAVICGNIGTSEPAAYRNIELLTKALPEGVELNWSIDGEKGIQLYEVQKASSNYMFFPIAWLDPSADQMYHKQYSCIDNTPPYQVTYYRIAIWDSSGQTTYSNVVQVGHKPVAPPSI